MHTLSRKKNLMFPMPVLLIATYNEDKTVNVMNAAWGTLEDSNMILIELTRDHKTSENILREKAFTVAFATEKHIKEADYFGLVSGNDTKDKFEKTHLHVHDAVVVHAPVIDEYPVSLLCRLERIDETNGDFAVYGKIENISVDDAFLDENGNLDIDKCGFVTYSSSDHSYRSVGKKVASSFSVGKEIK